ncbi:uncharacterized protein N7477_009159 [Penicillium maclennaniae]|uniref:uncharacterized protein n=1 Tax=Penicillium maclennaniae TaxID=1343394 RepID=UPI00253F7505|nr:uncharacterized protein N7477_009159 [Penicillium maclennaniae]KAJ5661543.1 hypothetical protein N7477_009159 [Penicillium maclennaniae]
MLRRRAVFQPHVETIRSLSITVNCLFQSSHAFEIHLKSLLQSFLVAIVIPHTEVADQAKQTIHLSGEGFCFLLIKKTVVASHKDAVFFWFDEF